MMTSTNLSYAPIFSMVSLVEQCYASAYRALEEDDLVAAHRLFGVMAAMAPRDERAWIGLGIIRERKEQWRAAAGLYGVATAFVPTSAWCHFGKGRCLSRMGRLSDAETSYGIAEALSDDPSLLGALERERSVS